MDHKFKVGAIVVTKDGKYYRITELTETGYKGRPLVKAKPVCESCRDAAEEDSGELTAVQVARTFGSEIPDHVCDARDNGYPCGCACNARQN